MPDYPYSRRQLFLGAARSFTRDEAIAAKKSLLPHVDESGYTPPATFFQQQIHQVMDIDPLYWSIRLHGLVKTPLALTLEKLESLPAVELSCTIACEQTNMRNTRIGHAHWRGVPMKALLAEVGVFPEAYHVYITSADGYTSSLSVETLTTAVLAYEMNGDILPREHGYPARLIVPGLYGYKMPKWIRHIELTHSPVLGYWESRGLPMSGGVEPVSVILTPRHLENVIGDISIAGIAFAGVQDITAVEISIDDAGWMPVPFRVASPYSWTPWQITWSPPAPGDYQIRARASTAEVMSNPQPQHSIIVRID